MVQKNLKSFKVYLKQSTETLISLKNLRLWRDNIVVSNFISFFIETGLDGR